jgi:nitrogenase molybdenum-iron protein beta chain
MCKAIVDAFCEPTTEKLRQINILPGWVEPADMRELKELSAQMGVDELVMFPDTSGVLDAPQIGTHEFYPRGGATVEQIRSAAASQGTIALGPLCSTAAAQRLDAKCGVPCKILDLPIGLHATDRFVEAVRKMARVKVPQVVTDQRGRLMDLITDMHQYFYGKTVALWGDPDQLVSLTEFLCDIDMKPKYIVTGTPGKAFLKRIDKAIAGRVEDVKVKQGAQADMFLMHQWIKNEPVDLLIGNTYGKYIARDENIPFVRHGFPILDRIGHQYFPTVGYRGGMRLLEQILNAFLDKQDRESPEESFELVM